MADEESKAQRGEVIPLRSPKRAGILTGVSSSRFSEAPASSYRKKAKYNEVLGRVQRGSYVLEHSTQKVWPE